MPQKKVFVYDSEDGLSVYPPVIVITTGDSLILVNTTEENLDWDVPAGVFGNTPHSEKVLQKDKSANRPLIGTATALVTAFQVKGRSSKRKGKGNSDPVIIIDL